MSRWRGSSAWRKQIGQAGTTAGGTHKPNKYGNEPIVVDGMRFDSKAEARRFCELKALRAAGHVLWFTRQVPFYLPGNTKYVADFVIAWRDKPPTVEDVTGVMTPVKALKLRQVSELHGVTVELVTKR